MYVRDKNTHKVLSVNGFSMKVFMKTVRLRPRYGFTSFRAFLLVVWGCGEPEVMQFASWVYSNEKTVSAI